MEHKKAIRSKIVFYSFHSFTETPLLVKKVCKQISRCFGRAQMKWVFMLSPWFHQGNGSYPKSEHAGSLALQCWYSWVDHLHPVSGYCESPIREHEIGQLPSLELSERVVACLGSERLWGLRPACRFRLKIPEDP